MKRARFGTVSEDTLQTEDLLEAFSAELEYQSRRQVKRFPRMKIRTLLREVARALKAGDAEQSGDLVDALVEALTEFAPPYAYFGALEGDAACFGFWLWGGFVEDFDGLRVDDTSEVPRAYSGEVLHVNDHGNATLYDAHRGRLREIWAVV